MIGAHGIYLDVQTIEDLAVTLDVPVEGMLAKVAAHELSHVFRGDADLADSPTHGWFSERDAQRDAWHVHAELIPDDALRRPARFGRFAQIRAADDQPAAYRQFPATPADWSSLARQQPVGSTNSWTLMPVRDVRELIVDRFVEIPVSDSVNLPVTCDTVYLRDREFVAGPWFVAAIGSEALLEQPRELHFIEHRARSAGFGQKAPTFKWLRLRAARSLRAGRSTDEALSAHSAHARL